MSLEHPLNDRIRASTIRLVEDGHHAAVIPLHEALRRARQAGLDLVQITAEDVPVCKILDADRWRYEQAKTAREHARRQRVMQVETKEIQLRPVTDANDLAIKSRRAKEFLAEGDKVRLVMRFKGRERTHREIGRQIMEQFLNLLGEHKIETGLSNGDRDMSLVIATTITKAEVMKLREQRHPVAAE